MKYSIVLFLTMFIAACSVGGPQVEDGTYEVDHSATKNSAEFKALKKVPQVAYVYNTSMLDSLVIRENRFYIKGKPCTFVEKDGISAVCTGDGDKIFLEFWVSKKGEHITFKDKFLDSRYAITIYLKKVSQ